MANLPMNTSYSGGDISSSLSNIKSLRDTNKVLREQVNRKLQDLLAKKSLAPDSNPGAASSGTGFGSLDRPSVARMMTQDAGRSRVGEQALSPTGTQAPEPLPEGTTWETGKSFLGNDYEKPPDDAKMYAFRSGIGGQRLTGMDSTSGQTPTLYKTTRYNQPLVDNYLRRGGIYTGSQYQIDHIVPTWAGGPDTALNKQLLGTEDHKKKTRIDAVARRLLKDGTITLNDATNLVMNYRDLDDAGLSDYTTGTFMPDSNTAAKKLSEWRDSTPHVGLGSIVDSFRDIGADLPDNVYGNLVKGFLNGVTFGLAGTGSKYAEKAAKDEDRGLKKAVDVTSYAIGNIAGVLVPVGGFLSPLAKAGLSKIFPALNTASKARNALRGVELASNVKSAGIVLPRIDSLSVLANTIGMVGYGQVASEFDDATTGERFKRALSDLAFGGTSAVIPSVVKKGVLNVPAVITSDFVISKLSGMPTYDAVVNSLVGGALHVATEAGNHEQYRTIADESSKAYLRQLGIPDPDKLSADGKTPIYSQEFFDGIEQAQFKKKDGTTENLIEKLVRTKYVSEEATRQFGMKYKNGFETVPSVSELPVPSTISKEAIANEKSRYEVAKQWLISRSKILAVETQSQPSTMNAVWSGLVKKPMDVITGKPLEDTFPSASGAETFTLKEAGLRDSIDQTMRILKFAKNAPESFSFSGKGIEAQAFLSSLDSLPKGTKVTSFSNETPVRRDSVISLDSGDGSPAVEAITVSTAANSRDAYTDIRQALVSLKKGTGLDTTHETPVGMMLNEPEVFRAYAINRSADGQAPMVEIMYQDRDGNPLGPFPTYTRADIDNGGNKYEAIRKSATTEDLAEMMASLGTKVIPLRVKTISSITEKNPRMDFVITPDDVASAKLFHDRSVNSYHTSVEKWKDYVEEARKDYEDERVKYKASKKARKEAKTVEEEAPAAAKDEVAPIVEKEEAAAIEPKAEELPTKPKLSEETVRKGILTEEEASDLFKKTPEDIAKQRADIDKEMAVLIAKCGK